MLCGVTEWVKIGVSTTVCVCVFYGRSLRLINIDSELSLPAGSQVDSMEQIGHTSQKN